MGPAQPGELHAPDAEVVLADHDGLVCGVHAAAGAGRAVWFAAELPSSLELFGRTVRRLGARAALSVSASVPGVFAMTTAGDDGQRLLHVLNITGHTPEVTLGFEDAALGVLHLPPRTGLMLPLGLRVTGGTVEWADAEIVRADAAGVEFGPGHQPDGSGVVRFRGPRPDAGAASVTQVGECWEVRSPDPIRLAW